MNMSKSMFLNWILWQCDVDIDTFWDSIAVSIIEKIVNNMMVKGGAL